MKLRQSTLAKWQRDFCLTEVISEVTGKLWDRSDEESSRNEGDGFLVYLEAQPFNWGAVESLGAAAFHQTHASVLADGDGPPSNGKDTDEEGFSGL